MYYRPRIIPCLSITGAHDLVKTTKFTRPRYLGDPINAVRIFNDKGVDELCVLDISASKSGQAPDFNYLKDIASEAFMPLSYGGGITKLDEIKRIFHMGFEKVIINTAFYHNPELIEKAVKLAGSQSIVISIDVKNDILGQKKCYVRGGTEKTGMNPVELAKRAERLGAGEILINSITHDGTMKGYDLHLIRSIVDAVDIPVIACGGAGSIKDLKSGLFEGHAHAVAAGSLFVYYGPEKAVLINMPDERVFFENGIYKK